MPIGFQGVTNKVLASFAGSASALGQVFVPVETDQGLEGPTLITSISEWVRVLGPRTSTSATSYDWAETYFALGGRRLWAIRIINAGSVKAKHALLDSGTKPTLTVEYATNGKAGNNYKVEVKVVSSTASIIILNSEGEVLEASPYGTRAELLTYFETHTTYVSVLASTELEHTTNLPATLAATSLTGGENATSVTEAEMVALIKKFTSPYGPGNVAIPGYTGEEAHKAIAEHCSTVRINRRGWPDLADSATVATLISEKGTIPVAQRSYISFTSSSAVIGGITQGTTRKVAGSALACGLQAAAAATGNLNTATAGPEWAVSPFVLSFTNTFTHAQAEELAAANINTWGEEQGQLCLLSGCFVTALGKEASSEGEIFWSFAATAERMALAYEGEPIMAKYGNKRIDGQGHLLTSLKGELNGLIKTHWEKGALFGSSATEAGTAEIGEPINTLAKEQAGEIFAQLQVRITESVQSEGLVIIYRPITQSVTI